MTPCELKAIARSARNSTRAVVPVIATVVLLLVIGVMLTYGLYQDYRHTLTRAQSTLQTQLYAFSNAVDRAFINADHLLHDVREEAGMVDLSPDGLRSLRSLLLRHLIAAHDLRGVRLFDHRGREHLRVGTVPGADSVAPPWLALALTQGVESELGAGSPGLGVSLALRERVEGIDGALLAVIDEELINEQLEYSVDGTGHRLLLLDVNDRILMAFPEMPASSVVDLTVLQAQGGASTDEAFSLRGTQVLIGQDRLGVIKQLAQQPVRAVALADREQVLADWRLRALLICSVYALVLLMALTYLLFGRQQRRREKQAINRLYQLYQAVEQLPAGVAMTGLDRRLVYANPAFLQRDGHTFGGLAGARLTDLIGVDAANQATLEANLTQGLAWHGEISFVAATGERHEAVTVTPVQNVDGSRASYFIISKDITERRQAEQRLRRYRAIVRASAELLALVGPDYRYIQASDAYQDYLGVTRAELEGAEVSALLGEALFQDEVRPRLDEALQGQVVRYTGWREYRGLGRRYCTFCYSPVLNEERVVEGVAVAVTDITDRRLVEEALERSEERFRRLAEDLQQKNRELERLSTTDSLTGLTNRGKLDSLLRHEIERARRYGSACSLIMLDIDHFKRVNDRFGHNMGDHVLRSVAAILRNATRKTDWVGRWGGEEFLILCPQTDLAGAAKLAEHLRQLMQSADVGLGEPVTCSFGVAMQCRTDQIHKLVKRADDALYQAKNSGRNRVVIEGEFTPKTATAH